MPTYDYKCAKCGKVFEVFEPMSAKPEKKCPKCGGKAARQFGAGIGIRSKSADAPSCSMADSCPSAHEGCGHGACDHCDFGD
jgi:putative FmdB family regulatory protein